MTREEAIEAIKFGHCDDMYYRKEYEEAVDMAIKVLEQLSKGYGRMIILSEDAVKREQTPLTLNFSCQKWISEVGLSNATVAIIEPDEESEVQDADSN